MTSIFEELAAPAGAGMTWERPGASAPRDFNPESFAGDLHRNDRLGSAWSPEQTLLKLVSELVVGLPALAEVQALRVWLYQPDNHTVRPQLLVANLSVKLRAGMELPLDDAIARWVWEHQRPLVISAGEESRFPDFTRRLLEWGIQYFCAVPLVLANRRIGVLGLASANREVLGNLDLEFVQRGATNTVNPVNRNLVFRRPAEIEDSASSEAMFSEEEASPVDNFEGIIGGSAVMRALCKQVKVVAPTGSTVLVLGETGTGKELIARAIHNLSPRCDRPFIKVNCAAIPAGLIESELFGHERGAFTGAVNRRMGRFEMADGGTLFLDEIGDIPLELQPKLLRVLQEQEFERIGSTQTTRVNVRIVAATSRDLPRMVAAREFRPDLFYRLNVFPLRVPGLRERSEDIAPLVRHFVELYADKAGKQVTEIPGDAMETLVRYSWPGNVRELQNIVERAVILSPGKVLRLALDELQPPQTIAACGADKCDDRTTLKDAEREHIVRALAATNWVLGGPKGAGARLGLARTTLIAKMQKLGISRAQA